MELIKKTLLFSILMPFLVHAEWVGPDVMIESQWGSGDAEFGIIIGDVPAYDILPGPYDISESGNIVMSDTINGRFKIFNTSNELTAVHTPPPINKTPNYWEIVPVFVKENISIILDEFYFYNTSNGLFNQVSSPKKVRSDQDLNGLLYLFQTKPSKQWLVYSSSGTLLEKFSQKPLVLGRVSDNVLVYDKKKTYTTIVAFDDKSLTIADHSKNLCGHFDRDFNGNVYCVEGNKAIRFNNCGRPTSVLNLPEDEIKIKPLNLPGVEDEWIINSSYMQPKLDRQGNVYAVRRTPETYSLVKWTWKDSLNDKNEGPDAPINITLKELSSSVIELNWEGSLQDPGCVTGYKILRSGTQGGAVDAVFNVNKGVSVAFDASVEPGKTYYYRVKALSAIGDSEASEEVLITLDAE